MERIKIKKNYCKLKKFIKAFDFSLGISIVIVIVGILVYNTDYQVAVPGVVIAKNGDIESKYKSSKIVDVYRIAVRPDNPEYQVYDVKINFGTYVTTNIGQHVVFKIPNPKNGILEDLQIVLLIFSIIAFIVVFVFEFHEYCRLNGYG